MSFTDLDGATRMILASDLSETQRVQDAVEAALQAHHYTEMDQFGIRLALEEALVNAIKHGNQCEPGKTVEVVYHVSPERLSISITDQGPGFDPDDLPDPTEPENLERGCGRGVFLMRNFMTEVAYNERGNMVRMVKDRTPE
jgi:serine/threonine-protein kinase RsbW